MAVIFIRARTLACGPAAPQGTSTVLALPPPCPSFGERGRRRFSSAVCRLAPDLPRADGLVPRAAVLGYDNRHDGDPRAPAGRRLPRAAQRPRCLRRPAAEEEARSDS